jgi:hypothetical protein
MCLGIAAGILRRINVNRIGAFGGQASLNPGLQIARHITD